MIIFHVILYFGKKMQFYFQNLCFSELRNVIDFKWLDFNYDQIKSFLVFGRDYWIREASTQTKESTPQRNSKSTKYIIENQNVSKFLHSNISILFKLYSWKFNYIIWLFANIIRLIFDSCILANQHGLFKTSYS